MLRIPALLLSFFVGSASLLRAQDATPAEAKPATGPILITNSDSPDGRKDITITDEDITITDDSGEGTASGTAHIREKASGRSLGSFEWSGFGAHVDADVFTILWRPDGGAFAIAYESNRGYVKCRVYVLSADGRCHEIELPDFVAQVAEKYHHELRGKGGEHPAKWLKGNLLTIEATEWSFVPKQQNGDRMLSYLVTLHIPTAAKRSRATVTNIRPAKEPHDF